MTVDNRPVVILGAGINGAALARELALLGAAVWVIEAGDIAAGATAYSSRLIHGGLRYLEYGERDLVREALAERRRLLRLAPQFVRPLRLHIPVARRGGGLLAAARRFLRGGADAATGRGLWLVRAGLWLYDRLSADDGLPKSKTLRVEDAPRLGVDPQKYRWLCGYSDAQVLYPERLTLAMLEDARRAAATNGVEFRLETHAAARLEGDDLHVAACGPRGAATMGSVRPAAIVNATGAWVDRTLQRLAIAGPPLLGPTKGSHFLTHQSAVRQALGDDGVYAEAADGRPVFVLPFGDAVLVGTTDLPFDGDPADADAAPAEIDYLLAAVNGVFPTVRLTRDDVAQHYSGVRPLPASGGAAPAGVTRRHWLHEHRDAPLPLYSLVGGKLTTCRSLAEAAAAQIASRLGREAAPVTRERPFPGGEDYPADAAALQREQTRLATAHGCGADQVAALWPLLGRRVAEALTECGAAAQASGGWASLADTPLPREVARWMIRREWAWTLADLAERRLMLVFQRSVSRAALRDLARLLVDEQRLPTEQTEAAVADLVARWRSRFGKMVRDASAADSL